jgi:cold shock CspA family protein
MSMVSRGKIARIVARVVARRRTQQEEIPELVQIVQRTLVQLAEPQPKVVTKHMAPAPEIVRQPRQRRVIAEEPVVEEVAVAPPAPKLLRRADVVVAPTVNENGGILAAPTGVLRGLVKWFDQRSRRGALRLPGHAGDVPIEPALLEEMGISRLYKGQEVEVTLASDGETPRVQQLALPGGAWRVNSTAGIVRSRHAKPVVVEMKREALRRVAARAEAELLLGPGRSR